MEGRTQQFFLVIFFFFFFFFSQHFTSYLWDDLEFFGGLYTFIIHAQVGVSKVEPPTTWLECMWGSPLAAYNPYRSPDRLPPPPTGATSPIYPPWQHSIRAQTTQQLPPQCLFAHLRMVIPYLKVHVQTDWGVEVGWCSIWYQSFDEVQFTAILCHQVLYVLWTDERLSGSAFWLSFQTLQFWILGLCSQSPIQNCPKALGFFFIPSRGLVSMVMFTHPTVATLLSTHHPLDITNYSRCGLEEAE